MNFILVFFVIIGLNIGLSDANAEEPGTKVWRDVAELSFVKTGGNTDVENLLINNAFKYLFSSSVTGSWNLHILNGETNNTKTAEKYDTELRLDKKYTDRVYSFGNVIWLQDKFAGVNPRKYVGLGGGYKILTGPTHTLLTEAGLNYTTENFTDGTDRDYMGGRLFGKYIYNFTEKNYFSQSVEYIPSFKEENNYFLNSETAVVSALNGYLSLKASYVVNYNNDPPVGKERTDTLTSTTLVVNF
jgi:putative salt-induced outer membrane protein